MPQHSADDLRRGLDLLAEETPSPTHMPAILAAARRRLRRRRRLARAAAGMAAGAVCLLALLLIPISFSVRAGSMVTAFWEDGNADVALVAGGLAGLEDVVDHRVAISGTRTWATVGFGHIAAAEAERRVRSLLRRHLDPAANLDVSAREITRRVGGNALAAVLEHVIRIRTTGLSRAELEAAIGEELARAGFSSEVFIATHPDGEMQIDINISQDEHSGSPADSVTQLMIELAP